MNVKQVRHKVDWKNVEHDRIRVEEEGISGYSAFYDNKKCGELVLYEDNIGRLWINNIAVYEEHQGRGIGLSLLYRAVQDYGAIYADAGMQKDEEVDDFDTRHLSIEGAALVNSAIRNGIMDHSWCFNPIYEKEDQEYWFSDDD